jgi:chromosome partitioning protein
MSEMRLAILSNAGGAGKSTLAVHLAFLLSRLKQSVALFDLDPQGSLTQFTGSKKPLPKLTLSAILGDSNFSGNWPFQEIWTEQKVQGVCLIQGSITLEQTQRELVLHPRGAYLLKDLLQDYPLTQDILIFDCPGTLGTLTTIALTAATHILIPVQLEPKSTGGAMELLKWLYEQFAQLRLEPRPKLLGLVPSQYDRHTAIHRNYLEQLQPIKAQLNLTCFPPIRNSKEFKNASEVGLPLHLYRPSHEAGGDFQEIVSAIKEEIKGDTKSLDKSGQPCF